MSRWLKSVDVLHALTQLGVSWVELSSPHGQGPELLELAHHLGQVGIVLDAIGWATAAQVMEAARVQAAAES
jgi:hypothetical protein